MIFPLWAKASLAAAALIATAGATWQVQEWRWEAKQAAALKKQQKAFQRQLARQNDIATEYEQSREQGRQEGITRETEIRTIYRDVPVPVECAAPDGVRSVLESAVNSANARAAGEPGAAVSASPESSDPAH